MTQSQALSILKTGTNVFLTGEPGAGKTHTINQYTAYLRSLGVDVAITASTGIAATHIGGMTIHSWSGIGIRQELTSYDLSKITTSDYIVKRITRAKVLIIEEVSMLLPETLSMVDMVCKKIKESSSPFGGMQVIFVGDFFQLPPVVRDGDRVTSRFAFDSDVWNETNPIVCYLTEQHRQDDEDFLRLLLSIRRSEFSEEDLSYIEKRLIDKVAIPEDVPKLFSHNADVDRVNNEVLEKLPGKVSTFNMTYHGSEGLLKSLIKGCLSPETLVLKVGAVVMFTKNNPKEGFVNGSIGEVLEFDKVSENPIVQLKNGRKITVVPMDWTVEENGKIRAQIAQLPLRLAWAITVHKSQGMSLDEAVVDLRDVFEFGQGYVALSRVRRLSGLFILGWNELTFQVHPDILEKDRTFHISSTAAERMLENLSEIDLKDRQDNFILANGGRKTSTTPKITDKGFGEIRKKHAKAYMSWDENQDKKLKELFREGESIKKLSEIFNRTKGAITSHLTKLGLDEFD